MSCGAGRGRGWLNLPKSNEPPKPGFAGAVASETSQPPVQNTGCEELVKRIGHLNLQDDGIRFNQKMKHVLSFWTKDCSSEEEVKTSFHQLFEQCLQDGELATKFVMFMSARSISKEWIHNCNPQREFLQHLQNKFEYIEQLQTTNPPSFRNCVLMLGDYYNKCRSYNGEQYTFLAPTILLSLNLLLSSKNVADIALFTTQISTNGASLRKVVPDDMTKLGFKVRSNLVEDSHHTKDGRLWLLLAVELFNVRFGVLHPEVYKFYEGHLGSAVANIQKLHEALSIQTIHTSKLLDSYQSNVNVLQISTSPSESSQSDIKSSKSSVEFNGTHHSTINHFQTDFQQQKPMGEKTGRPILGVGARFNKSKDEIESFNNKNSTSGRNYNKHPPNFKTPNKGWEHDDRFENEYFD